MPDLADRRILIAGSSRGIGAATARRATAAGARVIVHGRSDSSALRSISHELGSPAVHADGTDPAAVLELARRLSDSGRPVNTLVCTLGSVAPTAILESEDEAWLEMFRANVLASVHFLQAFAPQLEQSGRGRVVLVSSMRGVAELASPRIAAYSAAKAALINITVSFAKALAPHVAVNAVVPGFTLTDMAQTWSPEVREQTQSNLVGRPAEPEEIAEPILFLASSAASYVTGEILNVTGGFAATGK